MTERRYIQIYTGNGKGKTTAALGQCIRAVGSGLRSLIVMFMKDFPYGEVKVLKHLSRWITVEQYGNDRFVFEKRPPGPNDLACAKSALESVRQAMLSGRYDIVVLDEVCVCVYFGLIDVAEVIDLLDSKPDSVELILTGRYCPQEWLDRADLVSEMREVKHYFERGVIARKGFES
jgi:cob(I)alamin adenosyltransferase